MLLRELRRCDEAIAEVSKVLAATPTSPIALCELGNCHLFAGRPAEAEAAYAECVQKNPGYHEARVHLGSVQLNQGRYQDAATTLAEAARFLPKMAALHSNLATAYLGLNQLGLAEQHYQLAVRNDPRLFQAWFNLGRVQAATGRAEAARSALERAQQLNPRDPRVQQALQQLPR